MEIEKSKMQYTNCNPRDVKIETGCSVNKDDNTFQEIHSFCPGVARRENEYVAKESIPKGKNENSINLGFNKIITNLFENAQELNNISSGLDKTKLKIVEQVITPESHGIISKIIEQICRLSDLEKLVLYLKLPKGNDRSDPLKQPLNPLGNRLEISQTIMWIKTHLEEDQDVSLPKQDVYNEYIEHCNNISVKPLSTADFGKVMKQVFTRVRPRRLGTRGNSRYCYAGMCRKKNLKPPTLPDFRSSETEVVICEWASKVLGETFHCLSDLTNHLKLKKYMAVERVEENRYVDRRRRQSNTLGISKKGENKRKFQEVAAARQQVKTHPETKEQTSDGSSKRKRVRTVKSNQKRHSCKERKEAQVNSAQDIKKAVNLERTIDCETKLICDNSGIVEAERIIKMNDLRPDCSTKQTDSPLVISNETKIEQTTENSNFVEALSDSAKVNFIKRNETKPSDIFSPVKEVSIKLQEEKPTISSNDVRPNKKIPIPRLPKQKANKVTTNLIILPAAGCQNKRRQYKPIQPRPEPDEFKKPESRGVTPLTVDELKVETDDVETAGSLENNVIERFLHNDGNSQEQEEELIKYFKTDEDYLDSNISELGNKPVSQLRSLLERNSNSVDYNSGKLSTSGKRNFKSLSVNVSNTFVSSTIDNSAPSMAACNNNSFSTVLSNRSLPPNQTSLQSPSVLSRGSSARRRVSFENLPQTVPQSPNTRQQIFSFTPISPRPYSSVKNNVKSVSNKSSHSAFLSPNSNTSVPRMKTLPVQGIGSSSIVHHPSTNSAIRCQTLLLPHIANPPNLINLSPTSTNLNISDNSPELVSIQGSGKPSKLNSNENGVFLPPCSPATSCDSPIFNFQRKNLSPKSAIKTRMDTNKIPSLLETILLSGRPSDFKRTEQEERPSLKSNSSNRVHSTDPLSQEVSRFFPEEDARLNSFDFQPSFRSQSVPMVSSGALVSPLSSTQPFPAIFNHNISGNMTYLSSAIAPTPVPSESIDFGNTTESSSSNLVIIPADDISAFDEEQDPAQNNILLDSDNLKSILDLIQDCESKPLISGSESNRFAADMQQVSRSYPNTPVPYSNTFNKGDPIMSAFVPNPLESRGLQPNLSRSYPSTPLQSFPSLRNAGENVEDSISSSSVARNNFYSSLLTEVDDDLALRSLAVDLPECEDTFNNLEREVNDTVNEEDNLN